MNYNHEGISKQLKAIGSRKNKLLHKMTITLCVLMIIVLALSGTLGGAFVYGAFNALVDNSKEITYSDIAPSNYYTTIYDSQGNVMEKLVMAGSNREEVALSQIPDNLINAFIAIEDERFWTHNGIDLKGIVRAAVLGISTMHFNQGASTITQQLIKNSVFNGGSETSFGARVERKVQEQALAIILEEQLSKNVILENYLNTINLGSNCLGVQAAANRYFNKDVGDLTLSECAVIAAITQNPSGLNPIRFPEKNQRRQKQVLLNMKEQGYITQSEYDEAIADNVYDRIQITSSINSSGNIFSYFTDAVIEEVVDDLQERLGYSQTKAYNLLYSGGLTIYTTMDPDIQEIVDDEINDLDNYPYEYYTISYRLKVLHLDQTEESYTETDIRTFIQDKCGVEGFDLMFESEDEIDAYIDAFKSYTLDASDTIEKEDLVVTLEPQASMVIIDQSTGYVKAISGGRGEKTTNLALNRATQSTRQPGSTFKVLSTFAPALDTCGATLASVYYDSPVIADGQNFSNWWGDEYLGYVNIRDAIAYSMNLPTLHCLLETVSVDLAFDYVEKFGITTLVESQKGSDGSVYTDRVASLALGGITKGVTNLELTAAYAAIANGGVYNKPVFYTKILNHDGTVLLENVQESTTVIKASTASLLTSAMESTFGRNLSTDYTDINPNIKPTGLNHDFTSMTLAGKSGSTTDNNDVWFVGYSPYYTCGIWSGYDKGKALETGQDYHKEIWKRVMSRIHENLEDIGWAVNQDIVSAKICSKSGLLAVEGICDQAEDNGCVYTEYFVSGTEPKEYCSIHEKVSVCSISHMLSGDYCPASVLREQIYLKLDLNLLNADYKTDDVNYAMTSSMLFGNTCSTHNKPPETTTVPETTTEKETTTAEKTTAAEKTTTAEQEPSEEEPRTQEATAAEHENTTEATAEAFSPLDEAVQ
jgi:penicillin-binding protein 1A